MDEGSAGSSTAKYRRRNIHRNKEHARQPGHNSVRSSAVSPELLLKEYIFMET
jgi:hypothetical protein